MVRFEATTPRTPYSHFVRNEQLQPSLTAGFRNLLYVSITPRATFAAGTPTERDNAMWKFPITTEKQHRKNFSKTDRTWRLASCRKLVTVSPHSLLRLHSKRTTSHCLACSDHSNHLQPRTPPFKQQHPSATLTLPHFTHYILHSTLYTLHFTLYTPYLTHHFTHYILHSTFYTLHFTHYTLHSITPYLTRPYTVLFALPPPPGISTHLQPSPAGSFA